jgi:hypothetical protein
VRPGLALAAGTRSKSLPPSSDLAVQRTTNLTLAAPKRAHEQESGNREETEGSYAPQHRDAPLNSGTDALAPS